ncbi:hypothetical protein K505DRAFT_375922 [Melanomma pulvis-pyrius CBS 109.77]|uniref:Uncharacterized protein n=1 Tax=Melanomma pulvis-pyrius CBS 109.77 TaxID=1314802 RepID=A0A6A6X905_9PLEO|nr:hypothetical protein K505DRAFT_375922 [Melanomma pulvis-pyrius CBS 109.77]
MELARIAGYVVQNILEERKQTSRNLGKSFAYWVKAYGPKVSIHPLVSSLSSQPDVLPLCCHKEALISSLRSLRHQASLHCHEDKAVQRNTITNPIDHKRVGRPCLQTTPHPPPTKSGAIYVAVLTLLSHSPSAHINLTILESRPRFEGVDLAMSLLNMAPPEAQSRLHIRIAADCAIATEAGIMDPAAVAKHGDEVGALEARLFG